MKQTSVILKRQVPIRFNEPSRSWLGGLPMMPKLTRWPRDTEGAPLHFIAQICCTDLPKYLWNGLGPRKGWLLLFVETLKLDDYAENKVVQVLHTSRMGSERQPPKDAPTVRHSMSDYIDYSSPKIRPSVPKFWRKWPLDIVVQEYNPTIGPEECSPPSIKAEELYDGAVASKGLYGNTFALDCPLTWRGARYVIEGILRDLKPDEFERNFVGSSGLIDAPEFDTEWRRLAIMERAYNSPDYESGHIASWGKNSDLYARIEAEIRDERRVGWVKRAFNIIDAETDKHRAFKRELKEARVAGKAEVKQGSIIRETKNSSISNLQWNIERREEQRKALEAILEDYPGSDPEAALTAEIMQLGKEYLEWGARMAAAALAAMQKVDEHDPETTITAQEWAEMTSAFSKSSAHYWMKQVNVMRKASRDIRYDTHIGMAIREDLLDLYTRDNKASVNLPSSLVEDVEEKARYIEPDLPHRLGGLPNPVQDISLGQSDQLLFQIASDSAMGWMWGDVGALYITISENDLRKSRFSRIDAWIDGH
ncbi:MAG: DUF1963 domain-containing protein [Planctomycetaceae bacterium]|nr:DUF1963 domain-containing protein [Planctomycetaceae bacterium]